MQLSEMRTEVQSYLSNRGDLSDSDTDEMLNRMYRQLAMSFRFYELDQTDTSITTSDGTASYNVPTGARVIISIKITGDTEYILDPETIEWYEDQDTTSDNKGVPEKFVRYGSNLLLWPTPDDSYSLRVRYRKLPAELSQDSDEPVYPEDWHEVIILLSTSRLAFRFGDEKKGQNLKNEALGLISALQEDPTQDQRQRVGQVAYQRTRRGNIRRDPDYAESP